MIERRLFLDLRPLTGSPEFRRLWAGQSLSTIGGQMTVFAVALQVYTLTHSSAAVGATGLAVAIPRILLAMVGGTIGDSIGRRKLVLVTTSLQATVSILLAAQAFAELRQLWILYNLVILQALVGAVNAPARRAFTPLLLPKAQLAAGAALNALTLRLGTVAGPALAGVVAAAWGLKVCYTIDAASFTAALYGIGRLRPMRADGGTTRQGCRAATEALGYIRGHSVLAGAFLVDLCISLLGVPTALFPAINAERFGGSAATLGLLSAAGAAGGVLSSILSGPVGSIRQPGRAAVFACVLYGATIAGFGFANQLWLALALLFISGSADTTAVVLRSMMVQVTTPDRLRVRIASLEYVVGVGGTQIGYFRGGAIGSIASSTTSVVCGGLATILGVVLVGLGLPRFTRCQMAAAPATPNRGVPAHNPAGPSPLTDPTGRR